MIRLPSLFSIATLLLIAFTPISSALELTLDTTQKSGSYVVTQTNNKGFQVLYWNFKLDATFTGSGFNNTVTSITFDLHENPPQGNNKKPTNLAIYNGYFQTMNGSTPNFFSNAQQTMGLPYGLSPSTPLTDGNTPAVGIQTVAAPSSLTSFEQQLALNSFTAPANLTFDDYFIRWTSNKAFNGTMYTQSNGTTQVNNSGEYSLVIWTEDTGNYQIKNAGQLTIAGIPGVHYSSSSPGVINGTSGTLVMTAPGPLLVAPVPEPSTWAMTALAVFTFAMLALKKGRYIKPNRHNTKPQVA